MPFSAPFSNDKCLDSRIMKRLSRFHPSLQAAAGADIVMLDNYTPQGLAEDARKLKEKHPHVQVEASGVSESETMKVPRAVSHNVQVRIPLLLVRALCFLNAHRIGSQGITKDTIVAYCSPFIDIVSVGALTQGYACADFSLKIAKGRGVESINKTVAKS